MVNKVKILIVLGIVLIALCFMIPLLISVATRTSVNVIMNNQSGSSVMFVGINEGEEDGSTSPNSLLTVLSSGTTVNVPTWGHSCIRNVSIRYDNGNTRSFKNVNACDKSTIFLAQSTVTDEETHNPSFNLLGTSVIPITEIYVTPSELTQWGVNRLVNDQVIGQGQTFPVYLPTGKCLYDARVVLKNGQKAERRAIDACRISVIPLP